MKCMPRLFFALITAILFMTGCTTQQETAPELLSSTMENRPVWSQVG